MIYYHLFLCLFLMSRVLLLQRQGTRMNGQPICHRSISVQQLPQQEQQMLSPETKGDNSFREDHEFDHCATATSYLNVTVEDEMSCAIFRKQLKSVVVCKILELQNLVLNDWNQ